MSRLRGFSGAGILMKPLVLSDYVDGLDQLIKLGSLSAFIFSLIMRNILQDQQLSHCQMMTCNPKQ